MKCQPLLTYTLFKSIISRWHNERSLPYEEAHVLGICRDCMHGHVRLDGQSPPLRVLSAGGFRKLKVILTPFAQINPLFRGSHSELRQRYFSSYCGISVSSTSSKLPS